MTPPRILITYPFPLGRATGGARMTREIARHLGRAGARVTILPVSANVARGVFPRPEVEREFLGHEFDEELAGDSVDVQRVPQSGLHWIRDASRVRGAVEAIADRERVDAVLSYYMEGAFLPDVLERRRIRFGYISTWQSYAKALEAPLRAVPRSLWRRTVERLAVEPHRRADVLFATSRFTRDELVDVVGVRRERITVCPLGVDPRFLDLARAPEPGPKRLLFFGRIIPSKGVLDAIQALGRVAERGHGDFVLRLVGQGDHEWARRAAQEHGIEDRVELRGPAGDEELKEELSRAWLAVLPSHFEAFGLAFAEAQAAGLAVVAFRAGSVPEVVADGETGWLATLHDVEGLAERLEAALLDPDETAARGAAARERVRRLFTWERTAATILGGLGGRGDVPHSMSSSIEISKRLVLINSASSVARKVIILTVMIWVTAYYARRLDPAEYQLIPLTNSLIIFLPLIPMVFISGLKRYITDAYARGREDEVTGFVSTMFPPVLGVALLMLALGWTAAWFISSILVIEPQYVGQARIMFALLALNVSFRIAVSPFNAGFDLKQRYLMRNVLGLASELFRTALLLALLAHSTRAMWIVVSNTTAGMLEIIIATVISRRLVPSQRFVRGLFSWEKARPLLQFGGWSLITQVAVMIRENFDNLILNRMAGADQVSAFHLGSLVDRHIRHTYLEATSIAQPVVTAFNATGEKDRQRNTFFRVSRYSLWALLFAAAPLIVFRDEIARLYLRERYELYAVAATVMALLLARVLVIFPNSMLGMLAQARAEVRPIAIRAIVMSSANLGLTLYLVGSRGMGALGSALATVIVTFIGAPLVNWTLALRLAEARFGDWLRASLVPGMLPVLAGMPVWLAAWYWGAPETWGGVLAGFVGGAAVYLGVVWRYGLRGDERGEALAWFREMVGTDRPA